MVGVVHHVVPNGKSAMPKPAGGEHPDNGALAILGHWKGGSLVPDAKPPEIQGTSRTMFTGGVCHKQHGIWKAPIHAELRPEPRLVWSALLRTCLLLMHSRK